MPHDRSYWLLKTEPGEWSWQMQVEQPDGIGKWDGVKNPLAQKHMKSMQNGDLCFFYHSGSKAREVVGVVSVCDTWKEELLEDASGKYGTVKVKAIVALPKPVTLSQIKAEDGKLIQDFVMLRQTRLSVVPVSYRNWKAICEMGGTEASAMENAVPPSAIMNSDKQQGEDNSGTQTQSDILQGKPIVGQPESSRKRRGKTSKSPHPENCSQDHPEREEGMNVRKSSRLKKPRASTEHKEVSTKMRK